MSVSLKRSSLSEEDRFLIGEEDHLLLGQRAGVGPDSDDERTSKALTDLQIRVGTLLKAETVSFLFGAGASVECGGPLIGRVPLSLERALLADGVSSSAVPRVRGWLKLFYLAARRPSQSAEAGDIPFTRDAILDRHRRVFESKVKPLPVNLEELLSLLYNWKAALPVGSSRLRVDGFPPVSTSTGDVNLCLVRATHGLASLCELPITGKEDGLHTFSTFLRKILMRPLNLKRVNLFTLNYDTLIEQAADAEGVVLLDGLVGTQLRVFRPEAYEQDLYFPAETTEGRVHRLDRVIHLYKLHGSITWTASEPSLVNPYGVTCGPSPPDPSAHLLVYPTPAKVGDTLGMPYAELFRRFASTVVRPQSVLVVIGYGFGDEHVNAAIRQALAVPSFTLVIVDPKPQSGFVAALRGQGDHRVWICEGKTLGRFVGFVDRILPDLRDQEIRRNVSTTNSALSPNALAQGVRGNDE